ncbi:hypothetical protein DPMN_043740 [Dreissena polymorpha]|uniref:Uncharacterized protein n=1 Tax=Dreissena polymorpha TaxID=45954 RepID=A0A9D4D125_DREPO|nr:hypothetical protein DPMN_043740 [Dreissena polymorpha]
MSEIENNFYQLDNGVCRLEFVSSLLGTGFPDTVTAGNLTHTDEVLALLAKHALIVPFMKEIKLMEKLKAVGNYLYSRLVTFYRSGRGTGNFDMTWESYQTELSIEKLLWGHPLCSTSRLYSINLGPGVEYPSRSETDRMGFLCLNPVFTCCESEYSLPPLQIFSKNATVQHQIMNISGAVNLVEGCSGVLGRRLLMCLVSDFYVTGKVPLRENDFLLSLKAGAGSHGKRLIGRIIITELVKRLNTRAKPRYPRVFGCLLQMLRDRVTDMETVLQNEIISLNIGYFPAFREFDQSGNATWNWSFSYGFWVITNVSISSTCTAAAAEAEAAEMHSMILTEMEKSKLCHTSMYRDVVFPSLHQVLRKDAERKLSIDQKVAVLTFVSCIGLFKMGKYISFSALSTLELDLPIGQRMLIDLEVLSRFLVSGVNTLRVHRLHESIPWRLDLKAGSKIKPAVESRSVEDFQEENQQPI